MKGSFWRQLRDRLASPRHPSFVQLLDWHEGELEERWLVWTTRHVLACPKCRKEAERIRHVLDRSSEKLAETTEPPPMEQGVQRLAGILRDEMLVRDAREQLHQDGYLRLVARLRPYLGLYPLLLLEQSPAGGPS
ncbi:MAG: hypothetical protein EHM65_01265, partial [Acidobacteriales bacterium]